METTKKTKETKKTTPKTTAKAPISDANEFAVIQTGGKQYKVSVGQEVKIEILAGKHTEGDMVVFDKVLLVDNGSDTTIGTPHIAGAKVSATITKIGRDPKIDVIKYKQKSRYFKKNGHRQPFYKVKIEALK